MTDFMPNDSMVICPMYKFTLRYCQIIFRFYIRCIIKQFCIYIYYMTNRCCKIIFI